MASLKVSPACEVITDRYGKLITYCKAPTAWWYPTSGLGTMALCETHAEPHMRYVHKYEPSVPRDEGDVNA